MSALSPPPLGQIGEFDHIAVTSFLVGLARESTDSRALYQVLADDCLEIYTYGSLAYDSNKVQVNEIQSAIIAATDMQTRDAPTATLEPIETGEPPQSYWIGPPQASARLSIMSPPGQPLDPDAADQIRMMATQGMVKPQWLVDVDDRVISQVYQQLFDVYWQRSGADRFIRSNLLATNIQGWTFATYEFDDDAQKHILRMQSIRQVYIDPTIEDISEAAYVGIDFVLDAEQAKTLYPHLEAQIEENAQLGEPVRPDSTTMFGQQFNRNFQRPIIVMRVFWLRDQLIPMQPDEALTAGRLQQIQVPAQMPDGGSNENSGSLVHPADSAAPVVQPPTAQPGDDVGAAPVQPPTTPALALTSTGQQVAPGDPAWPARRGIRQITVIADVVADDRECEHWDIPLLHNVNLPLPGRPWGLGEPFRLSPLQNGRSRMMDALVQHCEFFRAPITTMSFSMRDSMPDEYKDGHVKPGMVIFVPDDLYAQSGGKIHSIIDPPQTPPALVEMQGVLKSEINEQSGHADVLRGIAPGAGMSGKALDTLQSGASSLIGFKSQRTGDVVERLARLMLHSLVNRLNVADVAKIVRKYPPDVLQAIMDRARQLEWQVNVTVTSGTGELKAQKKQEALQELQARIISMQTCRERFGEDDQQENDRIETEMRQQMAMMPQPQPPQPGQQQQPQQGPPNASHP